MRRRLLILITTMMTVSLLMGAINVAAVSASHKKKLDGCTPGYWKQSQHFDSWPAAYDPGDAFSSVFANAFPGDDLIDVLWQGGGGLNALGRHAVAALLNAASTSVDYALSPADVISMFNAAYASGNYETTKNTFAHYNEGTCPLN